MLAEEIRPLTGRSERALKKANNDDSDEEMKNYGKSKRTTRYGRNQAIYLPKDSESDESIFSESEEEPSKRDDEWDDECYVCKKDGDVLCCEDCPRVCHFKCTELKQRPKNEWYCQNCQAKKDRQRKFVEMNAERRKNAQSTNRR